MAGACVLGFWFSYCSADHQDTFPKGRTVRTFPRSVSQECYKVDKMGEGRKKQLKGQSTYCPYPPYLSLSFLHPPAGTEAPPGQLGEEGGARCQTMTSRTVFPGIPTLACKGFLGKLDLEDKVGDSSLVLQGQQALLPSATPGAWLTGCGPGSWRSVCNFKCPGKSLMGIRAMLLI